MDTKTFLGRVLPSEGVYVTLAVNGNRKKQEFFSTITELAEHTTVRSQAGDNIYYAISAYKTNKNRRKTNVRCTKVLILDIDCGDTKPYPDAQAGLKALLQYLKVTGLPRPMVVSSGNGLHVYWVLDRELPPDDWEPLARALKQSAGTHGLEIDLLPTANSALVLRATGTVNPKGGRTVTLLVDAPPVPVEVMKEKLGTAVQVIAKETIPAYVNVHDNRLSDALAIKQDYPPASPTVLVNKCQQIRFCVEKQKEVEEPLWYALMGVAAYCQNPEQTGIQWSNKHTEKFSEAVTLAKIAQWRDKTTGATTCKQFNTLRPNGCNKCRFKGKINSPVILGVQYEEVTISQDIIDKSAAEIPVPKPYKRTATGMKITIDETDIDICPFDIYPVSYGKDESLGYEVVRYHWKRPHIGWQELVLRQAYLTNNCAREFTTAIADQGIVLHTKEQTEHFQIMLRAYMNELKSIRSLTNLYMTNGWKNDNKEFVLGNTLIRCNEDGKAEEQPISLSARNTSLTDGYTTVGTLDNWLRIVESMDKADMLVHEFAIGVALSAPLYQFSGLKGMLFSLCGPTGAGKSLAQSLAQSVYGHPERLHFSAKSTPNAMFSRLGYCNNLPMTIDEMTLMDDKMVNDFCYWVSQGRDKSRLNQFSQEKEAATWATAVLGSTNTSMASKLLSSGLDTEAQMARLLEIDVPVQPILADSSGVGRTIYNALTHNNGHAGRVYLKYLVEMGPDNLRAVIHDALMQFHREFNVRFSGTERFWEHGMVMVYVGLKLGQDCGIVPFDYARPINHVCKKLQTARTSVLEHKCTSFDYIIEYITEHADKALVIMYTRADDSHTVDHLRLPRGEVRIRYEVSRKAQTLPFDLGTMYLDRPHFSRWLSRHGGDYRKLKDELENLNILRQPKADKYYMCKHSPLKQGQSYVLGINLNHPRLVGIISDIDEAEQATKLGQLSAVPPATEL